MNERTDFYTFTDIQNSDSLWTIEFMTTCGKHINMHFVHINWNMTICLHRICMKKNTVFIRKQRSVTI